MNRSIGLDAQLKNSDASLGTACLSNGRNAHHVSALSAESNPACPHNNRKQPRLTYPLRQVKFMRLQKEFIFVAKNTEWLKKR
jgi:hypothetical protein